MTSYLPLIVLAAPWLAAMVVVLGGARRRLPEVVALIAAALATVALLAGIGPALTGGAWFRVPWIPELGMAFALRLDALSVPFAVNTLIVALLALSYGWGYLHHVRSRHVCYALILTFIGGMLGTVLASDVLLFFIFWELMLVSSSMLLAGWGDGEQVGRVTLKYFLFTQGGSLFILLALARLVGLAGSSDLDVVIAAALALEQDERVSLTMLLLTGFGVKMAIFPLHLWLPDAHSIAPMPVTVLLAAAMLSMGAYGILLLPIGVLGGAGIRDLQAPLMVLALCSEAFGAFMCLWAQDIKRLVAYSSVSQMGYILFALSTLTPRGVAGGVLHVLMHGLIKAALFMGVGLVMHGTGRRNLPELGGLLRPMPSVMGGLAVGAVAIAGAPPFGTFHSEWLILSGGLSAGQDVLAYLQFGAPVLTAMYALWLVSRLAFGAAPDGLVLQRQPRSMRAAFVAALVGALAVGMLPQPFYRWGFAAASQVLIGASP